MNSKFESFASALPQAATTSNSNTEKDENQGFCSRVFQRIIFSSSTNFLSNIFSKFDMQDSTDMQKSYRVVLQSYCITLAKSSCQWIWKRKKCEICPFGNTFTMQIWWSVINFSNYEFTELETKTLGCTTEYSLEVRAPATTGTNSNTNVNTTKSEKRSFGQ